MPPATANNAAMQRQRCRSGDPPWAAATQDDPGIAPSTAASGNPRNAASAPCPARGDLPPAIEHRREDREMPSRGRLRLEQPNRRECLRSGRPPRNPGSRASSAKPYPAGPVGRRAPELGGRRPGGCDGARGGSPDIAETGIVSTSRATAVGKTIPDVIPPFITRSQNRRPVSPRSIALFAMMLSAARQDPDVPGRPSKVRGEDGSPRGAVDEGHPNCRMLPAA